MSICVIVQEFFYSGLGESQIGEAVIIERELEE